MRIKIIGNVLLALLLLCVLSACTRRDDISKVYDLEPSEMMVKLMETDTN